MVEDGAHARLLALETAVGFLAGEAKRASGYDLGAQLRELKEYIAAGLTTDPDQMAHKIDFMTALDALAEHCDESG